MSNIPYDSESDAKSVCSSICSQMSEMSVTYNGVDDVPLDRAVDEIFSQIQHHINQIHVELKNLVMSEDRGDDYLECLEYHEELTEHVHGACDMFKSVTKVSKQLLPSKPKGWVDPRKPVAKVDDSFVSS
jgi:hypothetical protein